MIDEKFVGLSAGALDFLQVTGRPARRQIIIKYEDGTSRLVSEHKFIEVSFETVSSSSSHLPLIAYYKDGALLYEERVQVEHHGAIFTALWDILAKSWVQETLWNDAEIQEYL
jgi:hypothetical protein